MAMVIEGVRYNEAEARFIEEMVSYRRNQTTAAALRMDQIGDIILVRNARD
jgi:hypothetical protein